MRDSALDLILSKSDILHVISNFIKVERKGKYHVALCPFHDDSTPSLQISTEKQIFKCFACGTGGNSVTFVQKYLKISFPNAMKKVAEIEQINVKEFAIQDMRQSSINNDPIIKMYKETFALALFQIMTTKDQNLIEYINKRKLTNDDFEKYRIGYLKGGNQLVNHLLSKGYTKEQILQSGLGKTDSNSLQLYDFIINRLVFFLSDNNGNIVGLSGRTVDNNPIKYLNTSETSHFKKGEILYNYHNAKENIYLDKNLYVTEGYMDAIALSKSGFQNTIALMGTALTSQQIASIKKLNCTVILALDSDKAGIKAEIEMIKALLSENIEVKKVKNKYKDFDELLNNEGIETVKKTALNHIDIYDYLFEYANETYGVKSDESKHSFISFFINFIKNLEPTVKDLWYKKLSVITEIDITAIREFSNLKYESKRKKSTKMINTSFKKYNTNEKQLFNLALNSKETLEKILSEKIKFKTKIYNDILSYLESQLPNDEININQVLSDIEENNDTDNKNEMIDIINSSIVISDFDEGLNRVENKIKVFNSKQKMSLLSELNDLENKRNFIIGTISLEKDIDKKSANLEELSKINIGISQIKKELQKANSK